MLEAKFKQDIMETALRYELDPIHELKTTVKVMNNMLEDGTLEQSAVEILKKCRTEVRKVVRKIKQLQKENALEERPTQHRA